MRKQKLLENDFLNLYKVLFLILFLTFLASISSLIKIKFKTLEQEVVFSGILTFLVELGIILYLFHSYTFYFISLFKREFKRSFLIGILLYFFLIPILSVLTLFIFYIFKKAKIEPSPQKIIFLYLKIKSIPILVFLFFLSSIVAPFFEEIIFRGFLYSAFKSRFSVPFSIFISSLIFSLLHGDIFVFHGIFLLGIFLAYIFEKTENLWICIGIHFANNFFSNLAIFFVKFFNLYQI